MFYRLTQAQADQLKTLRASRSSRRFFWRGVRQQLSLGSSKSTGTIRVAYDNPNNPLWLILRNKRTNMPMGGDATGESTTTLLALGLAPAAPTPAPAPKEAAPKPKAVPAAAKTAKPAAASKKAAEAKPKATPKAAAKRAPAAPKAKPAAAKTVKAPAKAVKAPSKAKAPLASKSTKASKPAATKPASKVARKSVSH